MIHSGFFPSKKGDRKYGHKEMNKPLEELITDGVIPYRGNALQVIANDDGTITIMPGMAHCRGHWMENTAQEKMLMPESNYVYDRIDLAVIRCDETEDVRDMYIYIKEGRADATPVAPELENTDVIKEMCLAEIRVKKQATNIMQSDITDTRANTKVCGWVAALIKEVDTSTLYEQWRKAYQDYYDKTKTDIDEWFDNIKEHLNKVGAIRQHRRTFVAESVPMSTFDIDIPLFNYDLDIVDIYINGIRLHEGEYQVKNKTQIVLNNEIDVVGTSIEIVVIRTIEDVDVTMLDRMEKETQNAIDTVDEIKRKIANGELKGDPGSRILYGQGEPTADNGNDGDWYYDTGSERWNVYYKSQDNWVKMGWIKGELGGDTVPIGAMLPCTTSTIPDGWLLCDGSLVSRTEYSELFAAIGESYGAGDGETTFALPNEPNPLAYTREGVEVQFIDRNPPLHMIIKAKQVVPLAAGITNDLESNSENDAFSAATVKRLLETKEVSWDEIPDKPSSFPPTAHNHTKSQITDFPTALKNPKALTFTGGATGSYDGSAAKTIAIPSLTGITGIKLFSVTVKPNNVNYFDVARASNEYIVPLHLSIGSVWIEGIQYSSVSVRIILNAATSSSITFTYMIVYGG